MASAIATGVPSTAARAVIMGCVMMATLMQTLDSTIVNVSLPYIQGAVAASSDEITWTLTAYIVAAAIMTPPIGWLSARYGRKNVFLVSIAGFTVTSMLCGASTSLAEIVAFRLLQGVFGASLVPLSQSTVLDIFPPEHRGQALSIWVLGVVVGPILGPTLGGYITDLYNWRWIFYINLPFGILSFLGLYRFLGDNDHNRALRFDWTGFAVLSIALASLQLMLDRGQVKDWFGSTEIIVYAILFVLGTYLFLVHIVTAEAPLIPLRLFRDTNFVSGMVMIFAVGMLILATVALLAPYLQALAGRSVIDTGLLLAPRGAGTMVGVLLAGRLSNRVDPRLLMLAGILLISATLWQMTLWTPDINAWTFSQNSIIQGFGLGLLFTPLQVVSFATLPAELRTDGTALFSLFRNIGLAIGVSVTSVVLIQMSQVLHSEIGAHVDAFNRNLQIGGAYLIWNTTTASGLATLDAEVNRQAAIIAYADDFKLLFFVSLMMLPLLVLMRAPKAGSAPAEAAAVE